MLTRAWRPGAWTLTARTKRLEDARGKPVELHVVALGGEHRVQAGVTLLLSLGGEVGRASVDSFAHFLGVDGPVAITIGLQTL